MFKRIDHVEILPTDFERTISFYTQILGFKLAERKKITTYPPLTEVAYIKLGDTTIEVMSMPEPAPAPKNFWEVGYKRIALEVDDMEKTVQYLKSKGVKITVPPANLGNSLRAEIADPDGLSIELREWFKK